MYNDFLTKLNSIYDKIQKSEFLRFLYNLFTSENNIKRYSKYNENFNVHSYRNLYIENLVQKHLDNNNIILHSYGYIIYNYSWHLGIFFKYFTLMFAFIIFIIFIIETYKFKKNSIITKIISYFIVWIKFFFEKLENTKEGFLMAKLMIFFLTLFFSSLFFFDDYINYIVFLEWNIPVCFGIILILELIWMLKSYIFIYLNGSKTKGSISLTFFEDLINFFILIIRIILQLIRGIICGIYHDLLRESNIKIILWLHEINFDWLKSIEFLSESIYIKFFYKILFVIFYLLIITFAIILMFLQALFLFLAIWLFCKCWFISVNNSKFFFKNKIKLFTLNKKINK